MIDSARLVADLKKQLKLLEADLRQRADDPETPWAQGLKLEYERAFARERTSRTWTEWSEDFLTQAAVAWIVAATFVRFCEDNDLLNGATVDGAPSPAPWIAGVGDRLDRAVEHQTAYFRANPTLTARDWLTQPFRALSALVAGRGILDPDHSPIWSITISADAAEGLLSFWRRTDADGSIVHDFTDPALGTRFLGDLYQDLSEAAQDKYALKQTPEFIEEYILDRTLTPAIAEFGLDVLKLIDPTCGSGHFLLGAFDRLVDAWAVKAPAMDRRTRVQKALNSIHGVDLNPFAVAIARFRLTVAALLASGGRSLVSAPAFAFKLAVGDSLLQWKADDVTLDLGDQKETFAYSTEDIREYVGILDTNQYHVVVGNPPYITVSDRALNKTYRTLYRTCKGQYQLTAPFMELFFELAVRAERDSPAGYIGKITGNGFMTREFGKPVIEDLLSGRDEFRNPVDLTDVIDTSGVYIPGHGTPTVLIFGRRRRRSSPIVRTVLGIRGEPVPPKIAAEGLVWKEIVDHIKDPEYQGLYVSVVDTSIESLAKHPWSLSGGAAGALKQALESNRAQKLANVTQLIGRYIHTGSDDAYFAPAGRWAKTTNTASSVRPVVEGDRVRDWAISPITEAIFPYDENLKPSLSDQGVARHLWLYRSVLGRRREPGGTHEEVGLTWYEFSRWHPERYRVPLGISFAFVSTHNHFALDRGGKVFNRSAPVIKLQADATEGDHHDLLGVLNSSAACFWLKQVSHNKGDSTDSAGARVTGDPAFDTYEFTSTKLQEFPLPPGQSVGRAREIDRLALALTERSPSALLSVGAGRIGELGIARQNWSETIEAMVFEQEELDWEVYRRYGLVEDTVIFSGKRVPIRAGQRAFEVSLARRLEAGSTQSAWFTRHGRQAITEMPADWPDEYRAVVQRRLDLIETDPMIRLLEQPEHKRRWVTPSWESQLKEALTTYILDRLESRDLWVDERGRPVIRSVAQLAEAVKNDADLRSAFVMLTGDSSVNIQTAVASLIAEEAVPAAAPQRYKPSGLTKFREWQAVWELQRAEDRGEKVTIPVPPKYAQADFAKASYWKARGKLDVPKERFIAYPGARRGADDSAVYGWAGWNHAEQGLATASLLVEMAGAGATVEQLMPLFAALTELEPWLAQWHSDVDPTAGVSPASAVGAVIDNQLTRAGITRDDVVAWRPAAATRGRRPAAASAPTTTTGEDTP